MKGIFVLILAFISANVFALDANHFTITRISAPYFIVDGNSPATITKAYVGFEVKNNNNSGVIYSSLRFTISSIGTSVSGQNYSVVSPASGIINVGTLAPGQSKVCYFYVSYPAHTTAQATFNIQLSDNTASSKTGSFVIRNRSSISANAGGTATQSISNQDLIGGIIQDDVTYVVGNVQNGDENDFQVAVSSQFDPTKISLLSTQVITSSVPGIAVGTTDSLYFISGNGTNGATVTIRWTFRITSFNITTYLLPCAGATSGSTNYKYALNTSLGSGTPVTISASANPLLITKTSDKILYGPNQPAVFTITITNPGAFGITIDRITDELPSGFTYQSLDAGSQVTASNSTSVPASGATGTISFEGGVTTGNTSYYIPASGSVIVKYTATSRSTAASSLTTTARDYIGSTLVGSAENTVSVTTTLPVRLISFKAQRIHSMVNLQWVTASETSSEKFEIERSNGNSSFMKIGEVRATGSSTVNTTYLFTDSFPAAGANHYRLKQVDQDARCQYSNVVSILPENISISSIKTFPNPFTSYTNVTVSSEKSQIVRLILSDITGKVIWTRNETCVKGTNTILLNEAGTLSHGTYLFKVLTEEGSFQEKLIKR